MVFELHYISLKLDNLEMFVAQSRGNSKSRNEEQNKIHSNEKRSRATSLTNRNIQKRTDSDIIKSHRILWILWNLVEIGVTVSETNISHMYIRLEFITFYESSPKYSLVPQIAGITTSSGGTTVHASQKISIFCFSRLANIYIRFVCKQTIKK